MADLPAAEDGPLDDSDRRGPFRPERLVTTRWHRSATLASYFFRVADVVLLSIVAVGAVIAVVDGRPGAAPVAAVAPIVIATVATGRLLRTGGLYAFRRHEHLAVHITWVVVTVAAGWGLALVSGAALGSENVLEAATVWSVFAVPGLLGFHSIWWLLVRRWRRAGRLTPNVVVVGATAHAERFIAEALAHRGVNVLGVFDDRLARAPRALLGVPVLGDCEALLAHRITPFVDRIVVALDPSATARFREVVSRVSALPNDVALVVDDLGEASRAALDRLGEAPLAPLVSDDPDRREFAKRVQDVIVSSVALLVLSPLLALIAAAVRLDSPGPAFFRQRRHGFNNEEIVVWKFRTMRHSTADPHASRQVTAGDERVTRLGRFLRSTSLDELPQLLNVIRGEMSVVGPRPHAVGMRTGEHESARLVADYAHRHRIKPGMTGWAAVNGSRGPLHTIEDIRRRVALDIEYIERHSLWLDLRVIAWTVPSVFGDRGAVR